MEEGLQVLPLFLILCRLDIFLRKLVLVGEGIRIHHTHVINTVCPLLTEVTDWDIHLFPDSSHQIGEFLVPRDLV